MPDAIFDSLWDATLWELDGEPGIWEPCWDAGNFLEDGAGPEERASAAELVLRRLHDEGWAIFVRRPWEQEQPPALDERLSDQEVEDLIQDRRWQFSEETVPAECNVWLVPTERHTQWKLSQLKPLDD